MKGKDTILSDFLSRQKNDNSNPNEIIPISFDMYNILESNLNSFDKNNNFGDSRYLIQTHSQAKTSGTKLPGSSWSTEGIKSKFKTRKTAYFAQTRKLREAKNRLGKSRIKEEET